MTKSPLPALHCKLVTNYPRHYGPLVIDDYSQNVQMPKEWATSREDWVPYGPEGSILSKHKD